MEKMNFVKTSDEGTAKQLIALGFQQISKDGQMYTFLNNGTKMTFDNDKNVVYTNNMCV